MAVLQMSIFGDETLRQPSQDVPKVSATVKQLVSDMFETMHAYQGVGLAAPQVGVNKRVVVIDIRDGSPLAMVNPKIVKKSSDTGVADEGCLSIPGVILPVERSRSITVEYRDVKGRHHKLQAAGLLARAIQHEIDHLDGIMFVDRVEDKQKLSVALAGMIGKLRNNLMPEPPKGNIFE